MSTQITPYQPSDIPQITRWLESMQDYLIDKDPIKRLRRQPNYGQVFTTQLLNQVTQNTGQIYVAAVDNQPAGFIAGFIEKQTQDNLLEVIPTKLGVITDLFVDQNYRSLGLGKALIEKMEAYFKSAGCDSFWLNVNSFNPAHNFYQKQGYVDRQIGMLKNI